VVESLANVCLDCGKPFELTAGERAWYATHKDLKTGESLQMPKRCKPCRERRKNGNVSTPEEVIPKGYDKQFMSSPPKKEPEEVRLVMATKDFEDLVMGEAVCWHGVRVVLADIGFDTMRKIIDQAEIERKLRAS